MNKFRRAILPIIGQDMAHRLTPQEITHYASARAADDIKRTTIHREISDIRAVLQVVRREGIIALVAEALP